MKHMYANISSFEEVATQHIMSPLKVMLPVQIQHPSMHLHMQHVLIILSNP